MECAVQFSIVILVIINFSDGFIYQRQSEICGYHNGHRKYLELGESGKLSANNITVPNVREIIDFQLSNWIKLIDFLSLITFQLAAYAKWLFIQVENSFHVPL